MARDKGVMHALIGLWEAGQASELAEGGKQFLPSGEGLVDIALVAHVEHQPVFFRVEHPVDGHRQLHRAQVGGQMPPGLGYVLHQKLPQLLTEPGQLLLSQRLDVGGRADAFQYHIFASSSLSGGRDAGSGPPNRPPWCSASWQRSWTAPCLRWSGRTPVR